MCVCEGVRLCVLQWVCVCEGVTALFASLREEESRKRIRQLKRQLTDVHKEKEEELTVSTLYMHDTIGRQLSSWTSSFGDHCL